MTLDFYFGLFSWIPFYLWPVRKNCVGLVFFLFPQMWYFRLVYVCRCPLLQIHCGQQTKDVFTVFGVIANEILCNTLPRILQSWQKWGQVKNKSLFCNLWNPAKPLWQWLRIANASLIFCQWSYMFHDPSRHTWTLPSNYPLSCYCCPSYNSWQFSDADG